MRSGGLRGVAVVLLVGVLGLTGCGEQDSSDLAAERIDARDVGKDDDLPAAVPTPTASTTIRYRGLPETPTPEPPDPDSAGTPTPEPPELDGTGLEAGMEALSADDRTLVDHHLGAPLGEGTWIVAAPMTVAEARDRLLGPDPQRARRRDFTSGRSSAYSFLQVGDGVVAWEQWGFADPPTRLLAALSGGGAVSAVVTENIEAMTRFGYARDGAVVFDASEYAFVDDLDEIPEEVRDLAGLAWVDLDGPMVDTADWFAVAMAMSEKVTGVRATSAVRDVEDWYAVPLPWGAAEDG